jgi:hypothetical protein
VTKLPKTAYFELQLWKELYFLHSPYFQAQQPLPTKRLLQQSSLLSSFWGGDGDSQKEYLMKKSKAMY